MSERAILHIDMNNFYASVECMLNPNLKEYPIAVCGSQEERHGIVLAKNYKAKAFGVSTGEAIWQAKQKCPNLVTVPPHYEQYMRFSKLAREIYGRYCQFDPNEHIEGMRTGQQIILDERLSEPARLGERNFTIAHECGHDLINWQDPDYIPHQIINYRIRSHHKKLKTENDFKEWQANVVASCLLLRPNLVGWTLYTFAKKEKITVYDTNILFRADRTILRMMAQYLGVSQECLFYRLDRLKMLEHKPLSEYDPVMDALLFWR